MVGNVEQLAPWVEAPWFVVFADFHGVNTPTMVAFKSLDRVGKRCAQLSLKSWYEQLQHPWAETALA